MFFSSDIFTIITATTFPFFYVESHFGEFMEIKDNLKFVFFSKLNSDLCKNEFNKGDCLD